MSASAPVLVGAMMLLCITGVPDSVSANCLRRIGGPGGTKHLLHTTAVDAKLHLPSAAAPLTATSKRKLLMTEAQLLMLDIMAEHFLAPLADFFKKQGTAGKDSSPKPSSTTPATASPKPSNPGPTPTPSATKPATSPAVSSGAAGQPPASTPSLTPSATPSTPTPSPPAAQPTPAATPQPPKTPTPSTPSSTPSSAPSSTPSSTPAPQPQPAASTPPRSTTPPPPPPSQPPASSTPPASTPPPPASSGGGGVSDSVLKGVLDQHNSMRAKHGASALTWSTTLQDGNAQKWADNCVMRHDNSGYGENLAMGYATFKDGVQAWYDEVSQYNFNNPGFSSATGHFTAIVWKSTTQLGCGYNTGCKLYVCRYNPHGNVQGQFPQNVAPAA